MSNQVIFETKNYIDDNEFKNEPQISHFFKVPQDSSTKSQLSRNFRNNFIRQRLKDLNAKYKKNKSITVTLQLADTYLLSFDRYKKAIKLYLEALVLNPDLISIYQKIILAYTMHNLYDKAEEYYQKLLSLTNERSDLLHQYALFKIRTFNKKKNFNSQIDDALNILNKIIESESDNFHVLNSLGFIILNLKNDIELARNYFLRALKLNPNYLDSINNLGVCHLKSNEFDEAENSFKKAIELEQYNYPEAYQNLATLYIIRENFVLALQILKKAKENGVMISDSSDHNYGWMLLKNSFFDEAIEWYSDKVQIEPKNNFLYNNLGFCYRKKGLNYEAEKNFLKATNIAKERAQISGQIELRSMLAFYNLGRLAVDRGDVVLIESTANDILTFNPEDAFGKYLLGARAIIREEYNIATAYYKQALEVNNKLAEVYPDLSFIYECIFQDYDAAIQLLEQALSLNLKRPLIDNNLSYAYIKSGNLKDAKMLLDQYNEDESIPSILATKGMLSFRMGDLKEGVRLYEKAIVQFPQSLQDLAHQIYLYEKALAHFNQNKYSESFALLTQAKRLRKDSYMSKDINSLIDTLSRLKVTST